MKNPSISGVSDNVDIVDKPDNQHCFTSSNSLAELEKEANVVNVVEYVMLDIDDTEQITVIVKCCYSNKLT